MRYPRIWQWWNPRKPDLRGTYPEPDLSDLILFVTDRCNMQCDHCIFWERIDTPGPELTLEQIQRLAGSISPLRTVAVTGGEPFLRNDLDAILETFFRDNGATHIHVNSNGLLLERMKKPIVSELSSQYEKLLTYQISLDGFEATHDRLRRMPGSFRKIVENLKQLLNLTRDNPYFRIVVLTNINKENYHEIDALGQFLWNDLCVEHAFDLVRGSRWSTWGIPEEIQVHEDPRDCELPPLEVLPDILETIRAVNTREGGRLDAWVRQLEIQVGLYLGKPSPIRCLTAGRTTGVVYTDGSVAACEFTVPFAHLQQYDYDFHRLWHSHEADARRRQITGCSCAHSCFVIGSLQEWEEQQAKLHPQHPAVAIR